MKWAVARPSGDFDHIEADEVECAAGALVVTKNEQHGAYLSSTEVVIIYAPGQWLTVVPEGE